MGMTPDGQPIGMTLIRTDIGCSDSRVYDEDTHWDPEVKTFFLNEIEYGGTTWFPRVLKFDAIPMWAELYATKALEIQEKMSSATKAKSARHPASVTTADSLCDGPSSAQSDTSESSSP